MSIPEMMTIGFSILTIIFSISAILDSYKTEKIVNKMMDDIKKRKFEQNERQHPTSLHTCRCELLD